LGLIDPTAVSRERLREVVENLNDCYLDTPPALDAVEAALGNLSHIVGHLHSTQLIEPVAELSPFLNLEKSQL
jgi:hypothetical protein